MRIPRFKKGKGPRRGQSFAEMMAEVKAQSPESYQEIVEWMRKQEPQLLTEHLPSEVKKKRCRRR